MGTPKKVAGYWMGSLFHGWFDFWMEFTLGPSSAFEEKGERNRRGRKKKRASEVRGSLGGGTIFFLFDPVFLSFSPLRSCIFSRVAWMGRIFWGFKDQIIQGSNGFNNGTISENSYVSNSNLRWGGPSSLFVWEKGGNAIYKNQNRVMTRNVKVRDRKLEAAGRLKYFLCAWKIITLDSKILDMVEHNPSWVCYIPLPT